MINSIVVHDIPLDVYPAMERWYYRDHSPESCRRYGPWWTSPEHPNDQFLCDLRSYTP
jgi:hypothetical protein